MPTTNRLKLNFIPKRGLDSEATLPNGMTVSIMVPPIPSTYVVTIFRDDDEPLASDHATTRAKALDLIADLYEEAIELDA